MPLSALGIATAVAPDAGGEVDVTALVGLAGQDAHAIGRRFARETSLEDAVRVAGETETSGYGIVARSTGACTTALGVTVVPSAGDTVSAGSSQVRLYRSAIPPGSFAFPGIDAVRGRASGSLRDPAEHPSARHATLTGDGDGVTSHTGRDVTERHLDAVGRVRSNATTVTLPSTEVVFDAIPCG